MEPSGLRETPAAAAVPTEVVAATRPNAIVETTSLCIEILHGSILPRYSAGLELVFRKNSLM
jgi:hypothetical protein